jgi:signal transduction histidine kinase
MFFTQKSVSTLSFMYTTIVHKIFIPQVQWFTWWSPPVLVLKTVVILSQWILLLEMSFLAWMTLVILTIYRETDLLCLRAQEYTNFVHCVWVLCVRFIADTSYLVATDNCVSGMGTDFINHLLLHLDLRWSQHAFEILLNKEHSLSVLLQNMLYGQTFCKIWPALRVTCKRTINRTVKRWVTGLMLDKNGFVFICEVKRGQKGLNLVGLFEGASLSVDQKGHELLCVCVVCACACFLMVYIYL